MVGVDEALCRLLEHLCSGGGGGGGGGGGVRLLGGLVGKCGLGGLWS